jgi:hypothetical protein
MSDGAPTILCEETPHLMRVAAIRKTTDPKLSFVRRTEWIAPFYCYISTGPHESQLMKMWHPIDNESCFTFYVHFDPSKPLNVPGIYANWGHRTEMPHYRTAHTRDNMHLQDRRRMQRNYSRRRAASGPRRAGKHGVELPQEHPARATRSSSLPQPDPEEARKWLRASPCRA